MKKMIFKYGIVASFIIIALNLLLFILGWEYNSKIITLNFIVIIATLIASNLKYRDKINNGKAKFTSLLKIGVSIGLIISLSLSIYYTIYPIYIDKQFNEKIILEERKYWQDKEIDKIKIEEKVAIKKRNLAPRLLFISYFIGYNFFIFFISLLSSIIIRSKQNQ